NRRRVQLGQHRSSSGRELRHHPRPGVDGDVQRAGTDYRGGDHDVAVIELRDVRRRIGMGGDHPTQLALRDLLQGLTGEESLSELPDTQTDAIAPADRILLEETA